MINQVAALRFLYLQHLVEFSTDLRHSRIFAADHEESPGAGSGADNVLYWPLQLL
jgi:hypothetical protein